MHRTRVNGDRTVHARMVGTTGVAEVVRYNRAGKWYIEKSWGKRQHVSIRDAANYAVRCSAEVFYGLPGGSMFDRIVRGEA